MFSLNLGKRRKLGKANVKPWIKKQAKNQYQTSKAWVVTEAIVVVILCLTIRQLTIRQLTIRQFIILLLLILFILL